MDELRARYHFQPEKNWMNDPNGPVVIDGKLHLFYQYNPFGAVWGNMTWGHAVAEDLVRWTHLPCALHPDQPYDKDGVFSGCCVMKDGLPHILYTGVKPETQCLAVGKKLRERQPKGLADLFQRGKRWRHALLVPGGNGRLRQAGALRELIFCPASGLAVFPDQAENVCHAITTYDFSFIIL